MSGASDFRNANGVYMKLMNFRRFDPNYTAEGKVGLTRGGHEEEIVWREFAEHPDRCRQVAAAIRAGVAAAGEAVIGGTEADITDEFEDATEGRLLAVTHLRRERNRKLVERKKAQVLKRHGSLQCEVCGFDFRDRYGERGGGYIECHHTKPLESLSADGGMTELNDLALLCANCHRMVHARRPWLSLHELRGTLKD